MTNTSITTTGDFFSSSVISIRGDSNVASSGNSSGLNIEGDFNRNEVLGGTTASSLSHIGGGNDTISLSNTQISGSGTGDNSKQLFVRGDYNEAFAVSFTGQGAQSTASIGGGNDSISVTSTIVSAESRFLNAAFLFLEG